MSRSSIPPAFCGKIIGSYHPETTVLTLIQYQFDATEDLYFNSHVYIQEDPYTGEPVQIYNHGPMDLSVGQDNAFYEVETTSSAKALRPGEFIQHWHRVCHLAGEPSELNLIVRRCWGIDLCQELKLTDGIAREKLTVPSSDLRPARQP